MTKTDLDRARLNLGARTLCPDPILGSRDGWRWCSKCQAYKSPEHVHGDPLEDLSREELLRIARGWCGWCRAYRPPGHIHKAKQTRRR